MLLAFLGRSFQGNGEGVIGTASALLEDAAPPEHEDAADEEMPLDKDFGNPSYSHRVPANIRLEADTPAPRKNHFRLLQGRRTSIQTWSTRKTNCFQNTWIETLLMFQNATPPEGVFPLYALQNLFDGSEDDRHPRSNRNLPCAVCTAGSTEKLLQHVLETSEDMSVTRLQQVGQLCWYIHKSYAKPLGEPSNRTVDMLTRNIQNKTHIPVSEQSPQRSS